MRSLLQDHYLIEFEDPASVERAVSEGAAHFSPERGGSGSGSGVIPICSPFMWFSNDRAGVNAAASSSVPVYVPAEETNQLKHEEVMAQVAEQSDVSWTYNFFRETISKMIFFLTADERSDEHFLRPEPNE